VDCVEFRIGFGAGEGGHPLFTLSRPKTLPPTGFGMRISTNEFGGHQGLRKFRNDRSRWFFRHAVGSKESVWVANPINLFLKKEYGFAH
jgi:hypothetical protein